MDDLNEKLSLARKSMRIRNRQLYGPVRLSWAEFKYIFRRNYLELSYVLLQKTIIKRSLVYWRNMNMVRLGSRDPDYYLRWNHRWEESRLLLRDVNATNSWNQCLTLRKKYQFSQEEMHQIWLSVFKQLWYGYTFFYNLHILWSEYSQGRSITTMLSDYVPLWIVEVNSLEKQMYHSSLIHNREYHRMDKRLIKYADTLANLLNTYNIYYGRMNTVSSLKMFTWTHNLAEMVVWRFLKRQYLHQEGGGSYSVFSTDEDPDRSERISKFVSKIVGETLFQLTCNWLETYTLVKLMGKASQPLKRLKLKFANDNFYFLFNIFYCIIQPIDADISKMLSEQGINALSGREIYRYIDVANYVALCLCSMLVVLCLLAVTISKVFRFLNLSNKFVNLMLDREVWVFMMRRWLDAAEFYTSYWLDSMFGIYLHGSSYRVQELVFCTILPYLIVTYFQQSVVIHQLWVTFLDMLSGMWYLRKIYRRYNWNRQSFIYFTRNIVPVPVTIQIVKMLFIWLYRVELNY